MSFEAPSLTFCAIPWMHLELQGDGKVVFCRTHGQKEIGNFCQNTLPEIWNSPEQKSIRARMIDGEGVSECGKCLRNEHFGSLSTRSLANRLYGSRIQQSVAGTESGKSPEFKPLYLSIKTSTHCNCRCRTCGPWNSTGWLGDYTKLTGLVFETPRIEEKQLLSALDSVLDSLELLYFVGGEPLLSELHYKALDQVLAHGRDDLHLSYSTNLTTLKFKSWSALDYWKRFEHVTLSLSVDDIGERNEYLRKGSVWQELLENRELLRRHAPHVRVIVHPTISAFNVAGLPHYMEWMISSGFIELQNGSFIFNRLEEPEHQSIQILPLEMKNKITSDIQTYLRDQLLKNYPLEHCLTTLRGLKGVLAYMNEADQSHRLPTFLKETQALDQIRGEAVLSDFPELEGLFG
ncbi:MAG TPA: hypothetical protein DCS07_14145 [Bdellovibrionales bacterium]|nr:MAG: hypothetical protein A2Z97_15560 [Bdellovibrionales bacterium GWB1_52_6]OFZ02907.1 MAG: hypothetical protein A2X97_04865 [Bdellovibrionales bacterium GWA1_52_35]OFZ37372.1 MAG: hypothetical protein A2070_03730 [Bdellovibrionales bacterium GWC1_52_8]HAR43752.1 hypothetical protein [Bdellovibrionales bacterium]HCM38490.1 hypothetical protein [Bdellovibrionales bacterium]